MASDIPTKWAIVQFGWGTEMGHIYSLNEWEIGYYKTEEAATATAKQMIQDGEAKMMAVLEVKTLLVPKPVVFMEMV